MIRLTAKEIARSDNGIAIISRPQANGGFKVMAVWTKNGTELGDKTFSEVVETKADVSRAAKEVARWISKMGYNCPMADASRTRTYCR